MREEARNEERWALDACGLARLRAALAECDEDFLAHPHVVITKSRKFGFETISGPYPTGVAALAAAERDAREAEQLGTAGADDCDYSVARLLPPE